MFRSCCVSSINDTVVVQVFQLPSDCAGIINPRCSLEPNHSDGIQSLCLNGTCLFSGGRDMSIMKWDLTDIPQLKQVLQHHFHYYVFINPLDSKGNYSATSNNTKLVHWPLMQWAVTYGTAKRGLGRAPPAQALSEVSNVTAHPTAASVPITVLLCDCLLPCSFNVAIKGLSLHRQKQWCCPSVCLFVTLFIWHHVSLNKNTYYLLKLF